jgi:hypothetical protein
MKNAVMSHLRFIIPLACTFTIGQSLPAQAPKAEKPRQFIYVLRLVPRLYSDSNWPNADQAALSRHFARFKHAIETGELIPLAGRTSESGDKTFGIAIFEAPNEAAAARAFMQADPAVARTDDGGTASFRCGARTQESIGRERVRRRRPLRSYLENHRAVGCHSHL